MKPFLLVRFSAAFLSEGGVTLASERFDAKNMHGAKCIAHRRMRVHGAASARIRNRQNGETETIKAKRYPCSTQPTSAPKS